MSERVRRRNKEIASSELAGLSATWAQDRVAAVAQASRAPMPFCERCEDEERSLTAAGRVHIGGYRRSVPLAEKPHVTRAWRRAVVVVGLLAVVVSCGDADVVVGDHRKSSLDPDTRVDERAGGACDRGSIALVMTRNEPDVMGGSEVVAIDHEGATALITGDWVATSPALSPDGRHVVVTRAEGDYESSGPESTSLWIIGVDGSGARQLTDGPLDDDPAWSPDGESIAFVRRADFSDEGADLLVVDASGGSPTVLLPAVGSGMSLRAPTWSRDGRQLAYVRTSVGPAPGYETTSEVWIVDGDGDRPRSVAEVPAVHTLSWSPDNASLLVSELGGETGTVSLLDVASGRQTVLFERAALAGWSQDGGRVYFVQRDTPPPEMTRWRLMVATLDGATSAVPIPVGAVTDSYVYRYFDLAVGPCG